MLSWDFSSYGTGKGGRKLLTYAYNQRVFVQGKSPRHNGALQLRANSFHFSREKSGHSLMNIPGYGVTYSSASFDPVPSVTSKYFEDKHADVIMRAQNKFLEETSSVRVNLYDLYRTRIESVNMVRKTIHTLTTAYRHLKKRRIKRFCQTLGITYRKPKGSDRSPPGLWLEYSYGWVPLVNDVYTMLSKPFEAPSAHIRQVIRDSEVYSTNYMPKYDNWRHKSYGVTTSRATAQGIIYVDLPAMHAASQYGINNPSLVAWEALPFSFVVDWFVPVGTFLESLGATGHIRFKDYSVTSKVEFQGSYTSWYKYSYWWGWEAAGVGSSTIHSRMSKRRQVNDNPTWTWPGLSSPMDQSLTRFSYALSLMASVFSSRK